MKHDFRKIFTVIALGVFLFCSSLAAFDINPEDPQRIGDPPTPSTTGEKDCSTYTPHPSCTGGCFLSEPEPNGGCECVELSTGKEYSCTAP